jgi:hypothetical protein
LSVISESMNSNDPGISAPGNHAWQTNDGRDG